MGLSSSSAFFGLTSGWGTPSSTNLLATVGKDCQAALNPRPLGPEHVAGFFACTFVGLPAFKQACVMAQKQICFFFFTEAGGKGGNLVIDKWRPLSHRWQQVAAEEKGIRRLWCTLCC